MFRLIFLCLVLRLEPVLIRLTIVAASLLIDFISSPGDPRFEILRIRSLRLFAQQRGLGRVEYSIGKQFHAVIHKSPSDGIAPNECRPSPAQWSHKQPINRNQRRHRLRAEYGYP